MAHVTGTFRDGTVVLNESVDWPDDTVVQVTVQDEAEDVCLDGTPWPKTLEEIQEWLAWFDSGEPLFSEEEYERFEAGRREEKELQNVLAQSEMNKLSKLMDS